MCWWWKMQPPDPEAEGLKRIAELASQIRNNKHLQTILSEANPGLRHKVFEQMRPHLQFKVNRKTLRRIANA